MIALKLTPLGTDSNSENQMSSNIGPVRKNFRYDTGEFPKTKFRKEDHPFTAAHLNSSPKQFSMVSEVTKKVNEFGVNPVYYVNAKKTEKFSFVDCSHPKHYAQRDLHPKTFPTPAQKRLFDPPPEVHGDFIDLTKCSPPEKKSVDAETYFNQQEENFRQAKDQFTQVKERCHSLFQKCLGEDVDRFEQTHFKQQEEKFQQVKEHFNNKEFEEVIKLCNSLLKECLGYDTWQKTWQLKEKATKISDMEKKVSETGNISLASEMYACILNDFPDCEETKRAQKVASLYSNFLDKAQRALDREDYASAILFADEILVYRSCCQQAREIREEAERALAVKEKRPLSPRLQENKTSAHTFSSPHGSLGVDNTHNDFLSNDKTLPIFYDLTDD
jgi:hypothetical protein